MDARERVVAVARGYLGRGPDCCGSAAPGYDLRRVSWCQIFWLHCLRTAGLTGRTWGEIASSGWVHGWLPVTNSPKPGDMAYLQMNQHGAVVELVDGNRVTTIDGNSVGGIVRRNVRSRAEFAAFYSVEKLLSPALRPCIADAWTTYSEPLEGRVRHMYLDVRGLVTVGVGNLLATPERAVSLPFRAGDGALADASAIRAEYARVKRMPPGLVASRYAGGLTLLDESIDSLVTAQLRANASALASAFDAWHSWPSDAQMGALSLAWAVGASLEKWPKFRAACRSRDWMTAGAESLIRETGNPGVRPRNARHRVLFANAAKVASTGADPYTLLWTGDTR